ncbi:TPA: sodium-dependent transporter, partial [Staphylococcus aureus]|nr:sodium-dependent transporter [Staphylococcus aureus]
QLLDKKLLQQYFGKDRFRLFNGWYYLIKYAMPVVIILVFIVQLFS